MRTKFECIDSKDGRLSIYKRDKNTRNLRNRRDAEEVQYVGMVQK